MDSNRTQRVFMAAFSDLTPEIRECIRKADQIVPNLQYTLRARMFGRPGVGSFVESAQFLRIDGVKGTEPVEVKSDAGSCVEALITSLALPPSEGSSELLMVVRYDGCSVSVVPHG